MGDGLIGDLGRLVFAGAAAFAWSRGWYWGMALWLVLWAIPYIDDTIAHFMGLP